MIKMIFHLSWLLAMAHPLHLSISNLDYRSEMNACSLSVKVFSDDFAGQIRAREGMQALPGRDTLCLSDSLLLKPYLAESLLIRLDQQAVPIGKWRLDSVSNNFEASWLYLSLDYEGAFREVSVRNVILFDAFDDQNNLLFISRDEEEKAFRLNHRKPAVTIRF